MDRARDRVRAAFDTFGEGVLVVDAAGQIMLANSVVRGWIGGESQALLGRAVIDVPALRAALPGDPHSYPWMRAMAAFTSWSSSSSF